jgi:glycosyltransferase involved in cell wall biosynthesis
MGSGGDDASRQPSLLYVSPVIPALTGNGLAMRAAHVLLALARSYRVSLLIAARYRSPAGRFVPAEIAAECREVVVVSAQEALLSTVVFRNAPFDVVHVFRLAAVAAAQPYFERDPPPQRHLDLDDVESTSRRRIAALYRRRGDKRGAHEEVEAATVAEAAETETLPLFDRVYVCAEGDVVRLPWHVRSRVTVLPNVLPMPAPLPPAPEEEAVEILFVGTLDYFPNAEGIAWFAREVLPAIRKRTRRPVALRIVGRGSSPLVTGLAALPGVELVGYAPDVREWYARCRIVVVPIRAGGGTRIKVLEAFALRRPVVATTIGAEGIDVRDGEQLLVADDSKAFAERCIRLIEEPGLGERLVANAYALFSARYELEALTTIVEAAPAPPPR